MNKTYTIEIVNGVWATTKTVDDRFWFVEHSAPRIGRFRTQKAAREWLERNGFEPYTSFKYRGKPFIYHSIQRGMQATIVDAATRVWIGGW